MASIFNIAISGLNSQQANMTVISNNIANSRSTAFKANSVNFQEEFVTHSGQYINGTHNQFGNGVSLSGVTSDWSTGSIEATGESADLAITGEGFLLVAYQGSTYYTRAGDFSLVADDATAPTMYYFMNTSGAVLLGGTGTTGGMVNNVSTTSYVRFNSAPSSYSISADGKVTAEPATVTVTNGQVALQRFNNPDSLERLENGLYRTTSLTTYGSVQPAVPGQLGAGTLLQGSLESSNVDLATEFTDMIITQRAYQGNAKVITTADEMLQTVLNMK